MFFRRAIGLFTGSKTLSVSYWRSAGWSDVRSDTAPLMVGLNLRRCEANGNEGGWVLRGDTMPVPDVIVCMYVQDGDLRLFLISLFRTIAGSPYFTGLARIFGTFCNFLGSKISEQPNQILRVFK